MVDFNGDGLLDILSGSYNPGHLFLFRGESGGTFAAGETLADRHGEPILVGAASAACAADWDRDGDLDLVVGNIRGEVFFIRNEGDVKNAAYAEAVPLEAAGRKLAVPHGDAGPILADWDRDGQLDLLVGCGDGSVLWYRREVSDQELPRLSEPVPLVSPGASQQGATGCGTRTKVCVTDFNSDGLDDLLVGDFAFMVATEEPASDEEQAAIELARRDYQSLMKEMIKAFTESGLEALRGEHRQSLEEPKDESVDDRAKRLEKSRELAQRIEEIQNKLLKPMAEKLMVLRTQGRMDNRRTPHGFVWLFLRQPAGLSESASP